MRSQTVRRLSSQASPQPQKELPRANVEVQCNIHTKPLCGLQTCPPIHALSRVALFLPHSPSRAFSFLNPPSRILSVSLPAHLLGTAEYSGASHRGLTSVCCSPSAVGLPGTRTNECPYQYPRPPSMLLRAARATAAAPAENRTGLKLIGAWRLAGVCFACQALLL